jgi:anti-anti-sigma factor
MTEAQLHSQSLEERVVVSIRGEIDLENAGRARDRILTAIPRAARGLVLDLSQVTHMDSAGVRLLFDLAGRLGERRLDVTIVAPVNSLLREVFEVVRLESVVAVVSSVDEALRLASREVTS